MEALSPFTMLPPHDRHDEQVARPPGELSACLRLMAAAKLYEVGDLSQERAAELAGLSRQAFLVNLSRLAVSPFQGV
jgi:hypothetical protein